MAALKERSWDEMLDSLLFIASGILFKMAGGWLLWQLTYCELLFCLHGVWLVCNR